MKFTQLLTALLLPVALTACVVTTGDGDGSDTLPTTTSSTATSDMSASGTSDATTDTTDATTDTTDATTDTTDATTDTTDATSDTTDTTGGGACYGDPALGECGCEGEIPVTLDGIEGSICSPPCDASTMCPAAEVGSPQCALALDGGTEASNCALVCSDPEGGTGCPTGATCKDSGQMGVGLCTYP